MAVRKFLKYLLPEIAPTERNRKKQTHGIALSFPVVRVLKSELRSPGRASRPEETETEKEKEKEKEKEQKEHGPGICPLRTERQRGDRSGRPDRVRPVSRP